MDIYKGKRISWIVALCQTTTFGNFILQEATPGSEGKDPYDTKIYHKFEKLLTLLIKRRFITLTTVVVTLVLSLVIMAVMPQSFFPKMNKPYFRADLVFPEGTEANLSLSGTGNKGNT